MKRASDFRSDTVTRPTAPMRAAMLEAEVGDDVLDGDPTVRALEQRAAAWLGKHGALFVPSGTMANQVALGASLSPGDEVVCERGSHVVCWESGAAAALSGILFQTLHAPDGALPVEELEAVLRPASIHCPRTRMIALEQSFMGSGEGAGGRVIPLEHVEAVAAFAREHGILVHVDGARLANAVVASGVAAERWAACADTVSICLSKGLGAPVGSLVAGDEAFVERARLVRKRLGGWMRQAGFLAAAGLWALEHHVERLAEDHALARRLAEELDRLPGLSASPKQVETNIVMVRVEHPRHDPASLALALEARGVRVLPMNARVLRFVTHLDLDEEDVERCVAELAELL